MNDEWTERRRSGDADGSSPPDRASVPVVGPDGHFDVEVLAGFAGQHVALTAEARSAVDAHLAACPACREMLAELQSVVAALSLLPDMESSRSFVLTPEMAGQRAPRQPAPASLRDAPAPIDMRQTAAWHERQMRAVRWATVAAALLFMFVVSADVMSNRVLRDPVERDTVVMSNRGGDVTDARAPESFVAPAAAEPTDGMVAEDAAGTTEELQTMSEDPPSATPASAAGAAEDQMRAVSGEIDDEKQEALESQDGTSGSATLLAGDEDRRSMSTPEHYWRLAQVGLAMLIVWLLAAMIALPRLRSGDRQR